MVKTGPVCHPNRVHYAKGMCRNCYRQQRRDAGIDKSLPYSSDYYFNNKSAAYHRQRKHYLKKKYRISVTDYNNMLAIQDGRCAICKRLPFKYKLAVDHNHETGTVRKLLCNVCNKYLHILEAWKFLPIAKNYLTEFSDAGKQYKG